MSGNGSYSSKEAQKAFLSLPKGDQEALIAAHKAEAQAMNDGVRGRVSGIVNDPAVLERRTRLNDASWALARLEALRKREDDVRLLKEAEMSIENFRAVISKHVNSPAFKGWDISKEDIEIIRRYVFSPSDIHDRLDLGPLKDMNFENLSAWRRLFEDSSFILAPWYVNSTYVQHDSGGRSRIGVHLSESALKQESEWISWLRIMHRNSWLEGDSNDASDLDFAKRLLHAVKGQYENALRLGSIKKASNPGFLGKLFKNHSDSTDIQENSPFYNNEFAARFVRSVNDGVPSRHLHMQMKRLEAFVESQSAYPHFTKAVSSFQSRIQIAHEILTAWCKIPWKFLYWNFSEPKESWSDSKNLDSELRRLDENVKWLQSLIDSSPTALPDSDNAYSIKDGAVYDTKTGEWLLSSGTLRY